MCSSRTYFGSHVTVCPGVSACECVWRMWELVKNKHQLFIELHTLRSVGLWIWHRSARNREYKDRTHSQWISIKSNFAFYPVLAGKIENLVRGSAWFNGLHWTIVSEVIFLAKFNESKMLTRKEVTSTTTPIVVMWKRNGRVVQKKTPVDFFFRRIVYTFRTGWAKYVNSEHSKFSNFE